MHTLQVFHGEWEEDGVHYVVDWKKEKSDDKPTVIQLVGLKHPVGNVEMAAPFIHEPTTNLPVPVVQAYLACESNRPPRR